MRKGEKGRERYPVAAGGPVFARKIIVK